MPAEKMPVEMPAKVSVEMPAVKSVEMPEILTRHNCQKGM